MRPSKGTVSGRVWEIADQLSRAGEPAHRADVVAKAVAENIDAKTASTQFGAWKRAIHPEFDGIRRTRGATEEDRQPVTPAAMNDSATLPDRHWGSLLKNGFIYGADWQGDGSGGLRLDRTPPDQPGVYVFVENDHVVYIGTTRRRLADRMRDYRIGHSSQKTSARIKDLLLNSLANGNAQRVLFATPGMSDWNGLPVELAAGLEAGLLARFQPPWNRKGLS
jgi:hypothetical protein